jgi:hypothetical protein
MRVTIGVLTRRETELQSAVVIIYPNIFRTICNNFQAIKELVNEIKNLL